MHFPKSDYDTVGVLIMIKLFQFKVKYRNKT